MPCSGCIGVPAAAGVEELLCAGPDGHRHNADTQRNERDDAELPDSEHCLDRRPEEAYERDPAHTREKDAVGRPRDREDREGG